MQEDNVTMKKWLSLLLVMTMLCAGTIQAQAAGTGGPYGGQITGVENETCGLTAP
mgnify:CR=1 FL=1